ncbi:WG repeat-containing protein [Hymenobacter lapidiphilus]|uniref:WG repeat-containing protein n=1 Tax=Hymenobacter lapidiphilus TaxID=2608003 RepID=A0A7Y7PR75_9BACT|nr:WG repeat-containing protein [Hymenobacter lapidiphilus]NVO32508.1 WG repeat-containing protein [Hymenobacter lapidiphilus]
MKYSLVIFLVFLTAVGGYAQRLVPFKSDSTWGYKDEADTIRIAPQFQYAARFIGGSAVVAKGGKLGAIGTDGRLLVPCKYEYLQPLDTTEYLFGFRAKYYGEHFMGVLSNANNIKIPAEYNGINKQNNSYIVSINKDSIIGESSIGDIRSMKSLYGLFNINGKLLLPCKYNYIRWHNDSLLVLTKGDKNALFDKNGEQLSGFDYMVFGNFIEGVAKARIGNKYGFIYPNGKLVVPVIFDSCANFANGYALVGNNKKWGAINKQGSIVVKLQYTYEMANAKVKKLPKVRQLK